MAPLPTSAARPVTEGGGKAAAVAASTAAPIAARTAKRRLTSPSVYSPHAAALVVTSPPASSSASSARFRGRARRARRLRAASHSRLRMDGRRARRNERLVPLAERPVGLDRSRRESIVHVGPVKVRSRGNPLMTVALAGAIAFRRWAEAPSQDDAPRQKVVGAGPDRPDQKRATPGRGRRPGHRSARPAASARVCACPAGGRTSRCPDSARATRPPSCRTPSRSPRACLRP